MSEESEMEWPSTLPPCRIIRGVVDRVAAAGADHVGRMWDEMSEQRWIPASERLPEGDVRVLVLVDGDVHIACLNWQYGWIYEDYGSLNPTHWMPLPEPPEVK